MCECVFREIYRPSLPSARLPPTAYSAQDVAAKLGGARIRKFFRNYGWFEGAVSSYDPATGRYVCTFDDGEEEKLTAEKLAPYLPKALASLL